MLEHCEHCQAYAPAWDAAEYADWVLVAGPTGIYAGVVCASCFLHEEISFGVAEVPPPRRARRRRTAGGRRPVRASAGAAEALAA